MVYSGVGSPSYAMTGDELYAQPKFNPSAANWQTFESSRGVAARLL